MIATDVIKKYDNKCVEMLTKRDDWGVLQAVPRDSILNWRAKLADSQLGFGIRQLIDQHHTKMLEELRALNARS